MRPDDLMCQTKVGLLNNENRNDTKNDTGDVNYNTVNTIAYIIMGLMHCQTKSDLRNAKNLVTEILF